MGADRRDCLLVEEPYTHILSQKHRGVRCDWCFLRIVADTHIYDTPSANRVDPDETAPTGAVSSGSTLFANMSNHVTMRSTSLKKCSACGFLQYCNRQCQRRDWTVHKIECPCVKAVLPKIPMDSVRLMLRLVINKQLKLPANSQWSRTFDDLMTHEAEIKADHERAEVFAKIMYTLKEYASTRVSLPDARELFTMFCKMTINSFTICDGELQEVGTGIYLSGSKLDHSCRPNAIATFQGTTLVVQATQKIENPVPEKIFISYIEQFGTSQDRRDQLQEQYYFTCKCELCQDGKMDEQMQGFCCLTLNCDGSIFMDDSDDMKPCSKCNKMSLSLDERQKFQKVRALQKDRLKELQEMKTSADPSSRYKMCTKYLADVKGILYEMNVDRVRLLDQALDAAIDSENWDKALEFGLQTLKPYRLYLPAPSPNLAIQLFKVGKLQAYLGSLTEALRSLQEAEGILAVTHGTDHEIYNDVIGAINQCEEESRVKLENSED